MGSLLINLITQFKKLNPFGTGSSRRLPMKPAARAPQPARLVIMPRNEFTDSQRSAWRQLQQDNRNQEIPHTLEKLIGDIRRSPKHILYAVSAKNLRRSSLNLGASGAAPQEGPSEPEKISAVATPSIESTPTVSASEVTLAASIPVNDSPNLDAQAFEDEIFDYLNDFTRTEAPHDFHWRTRVDLNSINKHTDTSFV